MNLLLDEFFLLTLTLHAAWIGGPVSAPLFRSSPEAAQNVFLRAFFALAMGLALQIALVFALGLCGLIRPLPLAAVGLFSALAAARFGFRSPLPKASLGEGVAAISLYAFAAASAIKAPGFFDDTMYHLPLARFYAETHGLGLDAYARFPLFPQSMEMLFAIGQSLRPDDALLSQGLASLPAFVAALGLIGAALWLQPSKFVAAGAAALFLGLPVVRRYLGYAYIDSGLAMFCFATALAAVLAPIRGSNTIFIGIGLLAGAAIGCKPQGLVFGALVGVMMIARGARPSPLFAFAMSAIMFGGGWYVRSLIISGDPLSPAGGPWFGYFLWNADDLAAQRAELATHGVGHAPWLLPQALIKGGGNWLIPALLAPILLRRERAAVFGLWGLFVAYAMFWMQSPQVDRYLAPLEGVGALLSVLLFGEIVRRLPVLAPKIAPRIPPWIDAVAAPALLVILAYAPIASASRELRRWDRVLNGRPGYIAMQRANLATEVYGDRLVQARLENARYFHHGITIGDWFGPGRYLQMLTPDGGRLISADDMRALLSRFDARLLAVNLATLQYDEADYARRFVTLYRDGTQALLAARD